MSLKLKLALMAIFILGVIISYIFAKKYKSKKVLIVTYCFLILILLLITYITLDLIIVGGI